MSDFWNEFKDLFKSENKKKSESINQINNILEKEKSSLVGKLDNLDRTYKNYEKSKEKKPDLESLFPTNSGLKEIDYKSKTDEEIYNLAKCEIEKNKNKDILNLNENYKNTLKTFDECKNNADENLKDSYAKLKNVYSDLKKNAESNALKRGLQRSSIIMNQIDNLDNSHMLSVGEVQKAYNDTISTIDLEIGKLENDKESAFEQLDLKYANDLNQKISDLKDERQSMKEIMNQQSKGNCCKLFT